MGELVKINIKWFGCRCSWFIIGEGWSTEIDWYQEIRRSIWNGKECLIIAHSCYVSDPQKPCAIFSEDLDGLIKCIEENEFAILDVKSLKQKLEFCP